jgi:hypothetical protein
MVQSRFAAAGIHLLISAAIISVLLAVVFFVWYPSPYFSLAGAHAPLLVLIGVDLVLGPLLTLLVYKVDKPSLRFDLAVIACIQLLALAYGGYSLASQRPVFLAFDRGTLEVISWADVKERPVPDDIAAQIPLAGPLPVWVYPEVDADFAFNVVIHGADDIYMYPERYRPFEQARGQMQVSGQVLTASFLKQEPALREKLAEAARKEGLALDDLVGLHAYPVNGRSEIWSAVIDPQAAEILVMVNAPVAWRYEPSVKEQPPVDVDDSDQAPPADAEAPAAS